MCFCSIDVEDLVLPVSSILFTSLVLTFLTSFGGSLSSEEKDLIKHFI